MRIHIVNGKIYPVKWVKLGKNWVISDAIKKVIKILVNNELPIFSKGNDAPRKGMEGKFIETTPDAAVKIKNILS